MRIALISFRRHKVNRTPKIFCCKMAPCGQNFSPCGPLTRLGRVWASTSFLILTTQHSKFNGNVGQFLKVNYNGLKDVIVGYSGARSLVLLFWVSRRKENLFMSLKMLGYRFARCYFFSTFPLLRLSFCSRSILYYNPGYDFIHPNFSTQNFKPKLQLKDFVSLECVKQPCRGLFAV